MRGRYLLIVAGGLAALSTSSCRALEEALRTPEPEAPIPVEPARLAGGGHRVAMGKETETMVETLQSTSEGRQEALDELRNVREQVAALNERVHAVTSERDAARSDRAQLESALERVNHQKVQLQEKVIALEIEMAELRQRALSQEIARLQEELMLEQRSAGVGVTEASPLDLEHHR